jgi:hypothetical protein
VENSISKKDGFRVKKDGFRVDDYFICFPDGDFIDEDENGAMTIAVDIYSIDVNNSLNPVKQESVTEELQVKIEAYINKFLEDAIKAAEAEIRTKTE